MRRKGRFNDSHERKTHAKKEREKLVHAADDSNQATKQARDETRLNKAGEEGSPAKNRDTRQLLVT